MRCSRGRSQHVRVLGSEGPRRLPPKASVTWDLLFLKQSRVVVSTAPLNEEKQGRGMESTDGHCRVESVWLWVIWAHGQKNPHCLSEHPCLSLHGSTLFQKSVHLERISYLKQVARIVQRIPTCHLSKFTS